MEGLANEGFGMSMQQKLSCEEKAINIDIGAGG
jgi:hypothetical protein